jgi:hypothetical protein
MSVSARALSAKRGIDQIDNLYEQIEKSDSDPTGDGEMNDL